MLLNKYLPVGQRVNTVFTRWHQRDTVTHHHLLLFSTSAASITLYILFLGYKQSTHWAFQTYLHPVLGGILLSFTR